MSGESAIPEGLADVPPGPRLAAMLDGVALGTCGSAQLQVVVAAWSRLLSHVQARFSEALLEAGYAAGDADPGKAAVAGARSRGLDDFSGTEVAWSLTWSRQAATAQLDAAHELVERLPAVFEALRAGRIDPCRAKVFCHAVRGLPDESARALAARFIGKAEKLTAAQLRDKLRYQVILADPGLAKERYKQRVVDRRVFLQQYLDGTAQLVGESLPPHLAAAGFDRVNRCAKAAKAAGDVRTLGQLRADAFIDFLTGNPFTLTPGTDPLTRDADAQARADGRDGDPVEADGDRQLVPRRQAPGEPKVGFWARKNDPNPRPTPPTQTRRRPPADWQAAARRHRPARRPDGDRLRGPAQRSGGQRFRGPAR